MRSKPTHAIESISLRSRPISRSVRLSAVLLPLASAAVIERLAGGPAGFACRQRRVQPKPGAPAQEDRSSRLASKEQKCENLDVTLRTVSDRILPGASQDLALHMKAPPAWAGRAVKPRSRKAVREAQGWSPLL